MSNFIGKFLVLVNLVISMVLLAWAGGIYLQKMDWGWKEPRKEYDRRIPSEMDKRIVAVHEAMLGVAAVEPGLKPAQAGLAAVEFYLPTNHLWYRDQLAFLRDSPDEKIAIKEIQFTKEGELILEPKNQIGRPVLDNPLKTVTRSYAKYRAELIKLNKDVEATTEEIKSWIEEQEKLTRHLLGDEKGKEKLGLYDLLEKEKKVQEQIKKEGEYLAPLWGDAMQRVDTYLFRYRLLEKDRDRLKKARGDREKD